MTNNKDILARRIYNILHSISIIVAGVCLMAGCLSIYSFGDGAYSRQIVAETFSKISLPVYLCLVLTVIGFVWDFISPSEKEKEKKFTPYAHLLNRLTAKKDLNDCDESLLQEIYKERKSRKLHTIIRTVIICISGAVFLGYALNSNNYQTDINASVIRAMWILIPCLVIPFAYSVFTAYFNEKSLKKEIELIKKAPANEKTEEIEDDASKSEKAVNIVRFALLFVSVGILLYGYFAGGTADVLTKAINICTECIGLG